MVPHRLFFIFVFIRCTQAQDFLSFFKPFLGSGIGANNGGGGGNPAAGFGSLLGNFAGTGNNAGAGSNMPFGEFAQLGMQLLNKNPQSQRNGFAPMMAQFFGGGAGPKPPQPAPGAGISTTDYDEFQQSAPQRRPPPPKPNKKPPGQGFKTAAQRAEAARKQAHREWQQMRAQQAAKQRAKHQTPKAQPQPGDAEERRLLKELRELERQERQERRRENLERRKNQQTRRPGPGAAPRPQPPRPPPPPAPHQMTLIDEDYEDEIPMQLTGARNMQQAAPPPPGRFTPRQARRIANQQQRQRKAQARRAASLIKQRQWLAHRNRQPPQTPQPTTPPTLPPFTFPPPPTPTPFPKLPNNANQILQDRFKAFAQPNKVFRMLEEVSTYSDVHQQADQDFGSVQKLMKSFFSAMANTNDQHTANIHLEPVYDGTEMGANRPLTNELFESDMVLTVEQLKGVVLAAAEQGHPGGRRKRKVITGGVYRWPKNKPIPYRFKGGDEKWKQLIRDGLDIWQKETCVRYQETETGVGDHIVYFRGSGCYSSVGRTGGSQMISIGYGCEDVGIVSHETGHSLGFWHEQSRPDRDDYISLNKDKIIRGTQGNFVKRTTSEIEDMGLPYDLGSVMHYGSTAFTTDWDDHTIVTNDKNYQRTIGQRKGPSFIDVKQVNRLYCNEVCPVDVGCKNGGYPDPNNCSRCRCPPGLGGITCDKVQESSGVCGGELQATGVWQELPFRGKGKCYWRITAPNARIRYILSKVEYRCEEVCKGFVEIKANSDFQQTGYRKCCDEGDVELTSEQAEMLILHDSTILDYETKFSLRYIMDSGAPVPKPPPPVWVPGSENRNFRGSGSIGPIEKFILQAIPKVRDANRPLESIVSILTEYTVGSLLGVSTTRK